MKQLNTYSYANGEVADAENLIECIEANRRGYASISFYNLSGSAIPVIKAGSTAEIGGTIYTAEADETAKFYNGTSFYAADAAHVSTGSYFLALVPASASSSEVTELVFCIMAITSKEYNQAYRGWYQTNTMNRIVGGLYIANVGSLVASEKWVMTHTPLSYNLENPDSPYFRLFSDGVEGVQRCNHNHISLYGTNSTKDHQTTPIDFGDFNATCPSRLVVPITAKAYGTNYGGYTTSYDVDLIALDQDGTELGSISTRTFSVGSDNFVTQKAVFNINPGRHKIRFTPKYFTWNFGGGGGPIGTGSLNVRTSCIAAYLTDIYGAIKGTY